MEVRFTIPGSPHGKARPRVVRDKKGGVHAYTPDETADYEDLVRGCYKAAGGMRFRDDSYIRMAVTAGFPIPKSTQKYKRALMLDGKILPSKKPDWDNIGKIVSDALNGVAYRDDAQIIEAWVEKRYVSGEGKTVVTLMEWEP